MQSSAERFREPGRTSAVGAGPHQRRRPPSARWLNAAGRYAYAGVLGLPPFIWQLIFLAGPLIFIVVITFWQVELFRLVPDLHFGNWLYIYTQQYVQDAYLRTFTFAAVATALISLAAFPCAYAIAFKLRPAARQFGLLLLILPFFTSYLVRIYAWQVVLADNGVINALLGIFSLGPFSMLNTTFGIFVGYATLCLPLVTLLQLLGLMYVDRDLVEAGHNLGCGRLATIWHVVIPSARIALVVAALFCFILTFGDFVSPMFLGGGVQPVLSTVIIDTVKSGQQWPRAAVVATTMVVTLLIIALASVWFAYRRPR